MVERSATEPPRRADRRRPVSSAARTPDDLAASPDRAPTRCVSSPSPVVRFHWTECHLFSVLLVTRKMWLLCYYFVENVGDLSDDFLEECVGSDFGEGDR